MHKHERNKKYLVLGMGKSGRAAAQFLLAKGYQVVGVDDNLEAMLDDPVMAQLCAEGLVISTDLNGLWGKGIDQVVCSPGIPSEHPVLASAKQKGIEVIGEVELACRYAKGICIGVTGTNGKTTVTLMLEHILNHSGLKAKAVGNVGVPLISEVDNSSHEVFVVELSSYQLETMSTKVLSHALILNITPDHLDRYPGMCEYIRAKFLIVDLLKSGGQCHIHESVRPMIPDGVSHTNLKTYGTDSSCDLCYGQRIFYGKTSPSLPLPEAFDRFHAHDLENIMAVYAVCREMGVSDSSFIEGVLTFKKLPHRIEFIRSCNDVSYYNDSKGTNIDAVIRAVEAMPAPVILIAGGVGKGCSFFSWIEKFSGKVKRICAIGEAAPSLKNELGKFIAVEIFDDLSSAVKAASTLAERGDVILLSPGCASFDMFKNYEHRGNEFKRIVNAL